MMAHSEVISLTSNGPLDLVEREGAEIGLQLISRKSEIICTNPVVSNSLLLSLPGVMVVDPVNATLLGSSVGDVPSISNTLASNLLLLNKMSETLQHLAAHDAILLL